MLTLNIIIGIATQNGFYNTTGFTLFKNVYAHTFTSNYYAKLASFIDEFQVESKLVYDNMANNNLTLAQKHSDEAASIFLWNLMSEFQERDKDNTDRLNTTVDNLQKFTSESKIGLKNSTDFQKQELNTIQKISQLTSDIDTEADRMLNDTEERQLVDNSNPIKQITDLFTNFFIGKTTDPNNTPINPMRFVEVVDNILRNYGDAYDVNFDMTDMAYMTLANNSHNMDMNNKGGKDTKNGIENSSFENAADYQTAEGLSSKLLEIFQEKLKPMMTNKESSSYSKTLENGIIELINSIKNKDSPTDIMMIVHTKIHPSLVSAFNLQIVSNTEL
ncbi:MAG: hypothetical protein P0116_16335 [Candidatus Nitrosocosmicus sp.]|nr:hypothetical protein [Candidatus Nitrosocosmicus sp.]